MVTDRFKATRAYRELVHFPVMVQEELAHLAASNRVDLNTVVVREADVLVGEPRTGLAVSVTRNRAVMI